MPKNTVPIIGIINMSTFEENDKIVATGRCLVKLLGKRERVDTDRITIDIPIKENAGRIKFGSRYGMRLPNGFSLNSFRLEIDTSEARSYDIQNKIVPVYKGEYRGRFLYDIRDWRTGKNRLGKIFIRDGLSMYFRQTIFNSLVLTVRETNKYDTEEGRKKIEKARKKAARLKDNDIILMYEKNCMRYEESASVLYERLIDAGYDNVYYIVDTSILAVKRLDEKYKKNLIEKDSDRHLEYFFACRKFISSETIDHSLQLRIANKSVLDKINEKGLSYVFLQHGVMYMVSLNSKLRTGFRKKSNYKIHRTVVSSEAEARHFIDLAGMKKEDLYITGLAKFDKSYRHDGASRIVIMPTWRRWEVNQAKEAVEETGYYKMLERMYKAVPEELRNEVIILPHPLIAEQFKEEHTLGNHFLMAESYDEVFRDCNLLITDYSSIAYDAFYRGANVVFDWSELDECMEHYGEETYLMLNDDNVFGRVARNPSELADAVRSSYDAPQREEDIKRYGKLVEFHDGKNSDRIMEMLIKDGMIERK